MKKIAVLTSGGDAPGMNAAIRSIVRTALAQKIEVLGIKNGFTGLLTNQTISCHIDTVANIIQYGGTLLKTGRCPEMMKPEGLEQAIRNIKQLNVDGLICIGGDGTYRGALSLAEKVAIPCVGIPGTIDNDIPATDLTIGFNTAINTALEAIDRLRDTAASHDRLFILEVMGRRCGQIAVHVGLAGGAEDVFFPEAPTEISTAIHRIKAGMERGKLSSIFVMAEGHPKVSPQSLAHEIKKALGLEARICVLGHLQRGGPPSALDRILACRMGELAVTSLKDQTQPEMTSWQNGSLKRLPLTLVNQPSSKKNELDQLRNLTALLSGCQS